MQDVLEANNGMTLTDDPCADVLLVNTCSCAKRRREKVFLCGRWRLLKQQRPHVVIGVGAGGKSGRRRHHDARAFVDLVFTSNSHRLPEMLQGLRQSGRRRSHQLPRIEKFDGCRLRGEGATGSFSIMEAAASTTFCVCRIRAARRSAVPSTKCWRNPRIGARRP